MRGTCKQREARWGCERRESETHRPHEPNATQKAFDEMDSLFFPKPWPSHIPICERERGFVGLPDDIYNSFLNKLARRKKRSFPSISSVDDLRGQPYLVTLVNGRLYDTSLASADLYVADGLEAGTPFTRPIRKSSEQLGTGFQYNTAFGICFQIGIRSRELIHVLRRKEIALLENGVSREEVLETITKHAMRIKQRSIFRKWEKVVAKLKRREEIKVSLVKAKAARSVAMWPKLAKRLQHNDGLRKVAAEKKAKRMRFRYLNLWRSAIKQVVADNATAKPVIALVPKEKKAAANTEAPSTRVYARKEASKNTRKKPSDTTDKAKREVEKEEKLALLAENTEAKAAVAAADKAAREALAEARRLGREIGGS